MHQPSSTADAPAAGASCCPLHTCARSWQRLWAQTGRIAPYPPAQMGGWQDMICGIAWHGITPPIQLGGTSFLFHIQEPHLCNSTKHTAALNLWHDDSNDDDSNDNDVDAGAAHLESDSWGIGQGMARYHAFYSIRRYSFSAPHLRTSSL